MTMSLTDALRHETFLRSRADADDRELELDLPQLLIVGGRRVLDHCPRCDRHGPVTAPDGLCATCVVGGLLTTA